MTAGFENFTAPMGKRRCAAQGGLDRHQCVLTTLYQQARLVDLGKVVTQVGVGQQLKPIDQRRQCCVIRVRLTGSIKLGLQRAPCRLAEQLQTKEALQGCAAGFGIAFAKRVDGVGWQRARSVCSTDKACGGTDQDQP